MAVKSLKANFTINVIGAVVPLVVALVTVPIYIHHIGAARYGVLSIVWVLLGYFGFLDLGLSRAAANALAKLRDAPQPERARVLVTATVLNVGLGLFGSFFLAIGGSYLLQHVLAIPDALKPEIAQAFPWIVALFPLALISGVGIGALESREKFLTANVLQVVGTSVGQIVPVILAVVVSPSLAAVIPAAAVARTLSVIAILVVVYREEGPLRVSAFDRSQAGTLLKYGGWVTISSALSPLLVSLDQFVIGSALGVASVAHYAVPMNLVSRSQFFPSALARTLFPRMSRQNSIEAQGLASRAFVLLGHGYAITCAPAIMLSSSFLQTWIGRDFEKQSSSVAVILFLGAWVNGLAFIPYEMIQSQGKPQITGKFHLLETVPFITVLWFFTTKYGIFGAAVAWALRCLIDAACLFWASKMSPKVVLQLLVPCFVLIISAALALDLDLQLDLAIAFSLCLSAVAFLSALLSSYDIRMMAVGCGAVWIRSLKHLCGFSGDDANAER